MKFFCPHCDQHLEADDDTAGMKVECPTCGRTLLIPTGTAQPDTPSAAQPGADPEQAGAPYTLSDRDLALVADTSDSTGLPRSVGREAPPQIRTLVTAQDAALAADSKGRGFEISTEGKFRKVRMKALAKREYGRYRGQGRLTISHEGIRIEGRHVKSMGARWGIGILIMIASGILTGGAIILGIIPVYLLMEYAILTRKNITIPWTSLQKYAFDIRHGLVGILFEGPDWTSPAIIRTTDLAQIARALRAVAKEKDATPEVRCG